MPIFLLKASLRRPDCLARKEPVTKVPHNLLLAATPAVHQATGKVGQFPTALLLREYASLCSSEFGMRKVLYTPCNSLWLPLLDTLTYPCIRCSLSTYLLAGIGQPRGSIAAAFPNPCRASSIEKIHTQKIFLGRQL